MTRENKRLIVRIVKYMRKECDRLEDIISTEEDRLDGWFDNLKNSQAFDDASDLLDEVTENVETITAALEELELLCS